MEENRRFIYTSVFTVRFCVAFCTHVCENAMYPEITLL
jgi:hypothetical protein